MQVLQPLSEHTMALLTSMLVVIAMQQQQQQQQQQQVYCNPERMQDYKPGHSLTAAQGLGGRC